MKRKKLSLKALELDDSLEVINLEDLSSFLGGSGSPSNDCVFNCYDYLDGSAHDALYYRFAAEYYYGFTPDSSGLQTQYIDDLGQTWGHMRVTELTPGSGSGGSSGIVMTGSGLLLNGDRIMMTFAGAGGADHAVVVTGAHTDSFGTAVIDYYDPTTGETGTRTSGDYSGLYGVGAVGTYP